MKEKHYTLSELVGFGNYLLSEKRKQSIVHEYAADAVHQEDIANWEEQKESWESTKA